MNLEISFGALSPKLSKQLKEQNLICAEDELGRWQRIADAITTLLLYGIISDSQSANARQKLIKRMAKGVRP